jgi:hypothetical protein
MSAVLPKKKKGGNEKRDNQVDEDRAHRGGKRGVGLLKSCIRAAADDVAGP